jgi:hypothetical protein
VRNAPATEPLAGHAPPSRRGGIGIDTVWMAVAVGAPAVATLLGTIGVVDLAYHLRAGELSLSSGSIVRVDTFSFVDQGAPWLNQQWGAQILLALVARSGGFEALQFVRSLIVGAVAGLVFASCRARGAPVRISAILTLAGILLTLPTFGVRPQLFGALLFASTLYLLVGRDHHPGRIWLLPLLSAVWVNTHGSFVLLPVLIVLTILDSTARRKKDLGRLWLVGSASLVATLVNPFGISVWTYALDLITDPVVRTWIDEWRPIAVNTPFGWAFFASVALVVGYLARRREAAPWSDLMWLGAFFAIGLGAIRAIVWWGLVAPVIVAGLVPRARRRIDDRGSSTLNLGVIAALGVAALVLLPWFRGVRLLWAPESLVVPVRSVSEIGDRLLVAQPWASWFEYRLPGRPVFVDSRIELYPASVWADYGAIRTARADWSELLDGWNVDVIVTESDWAVERFLRVDPGWRLAFENQAGSVFVRG